MQKMLIFSEKHTPKNRVFTDTNKWRIVKAKKDYRFKLKRLRVKRVGVKQIKIRNFFMEETQ